MTDPLDRRPAHPVAHGPFANPYLLRVTEKFGPRAYRRTSICMEFERFLRRIAREVGNGEKIGRVGLEIGTYNGLSAVILSQFFDQVIAVTIETQPVEQLLKHQIVEHLGIKNIRFIDVKDNNHKRTVVQAVDYDFAYLDGDHQHDTLADWELVRGCGRVLFHEYWPLQPPVWDLVESLPPAQVIRAEVDCFAFWDAHRG